MNLECVACDPEMKLTRGNGTPTSPWKKSHRSQNISSR